mgnify:CR=1 FL=1
MSEIAFETREYSDEELCAQVANGCREAEEMLVKRYLRVVRVYARPYFLAGGDSEDLIQEAMFGLLKASANLTPGTTRNSKPLQRFAFVTASVRSLSMLPVVNMHR